MHKDDPVPEGDTATDAAAYIADLSASLATLARRHRLDLLVYLLDMTRMEAESLARGQDSTEVAAG
jgi:hypothetical protein